MLSRFAFRSLAVPAAALLTATLSLCGASEGSATLRPTAEGKLGSAIFRWEELPVRKTPSGERREVVDKPTATLANFECHVTTLNAGLASHAPHQHAQEEFIILKEGTLEVSINGKTETAGPGSLFFFASNDLHNVRNVGDTPATYFVFNIRTEATASVPKTPAAESAAPGLLPSAVYHWDKLPIRKTEVGFWRSLYEAPTVTMASFEGHVTTLNPNVTSHPPHRHVDEEILVIREGLVDVTIEDKTYRVGPGSICYFESNDAHGARTASETPAMYYAIRFVPKAK